MKFFIKGSISKCSINLKIHAKASGCRHASGVTEAFVPDAVGRLSSEAVFKLALKESIVPSTVKLDLNGIVVIVGNYGSGKTEVAINLAVDQARKGTAVRVADLDLVNPYFRTREARQILSKFGIDIVLPPDGWLKADLPILSPRVAGLIRDPGQLAILDVGGDGVGARVLAALADAFAATAQIPMQLLQVINPFRPNTASVQQCLTMQRTIEATSRLKVTGWIGNPHLMDETTEDHIRQGYALMQALADHSGLPLVCMTVSAALAPQVQPLTMSCPILVIQRQLMPPWRAPVDF